MCCYCREMQGVWLLVQVKLSEIQISSFYNVSIYFVTSTCWINPILSSAAGKIEDRVVTIVSKFCTYVVHVNMYMSLTWHPKLHSKILKMKYWTLMCMHVCVLWWIFTAEIRLCKTAALGFPFCNFKFTVNLRWALCGQFSASLLWLVYYEA